MLTSYFLVPFPIQELLIESIIRMYQHLLVALSTKEIHTKVGDCWEVFQLKFILGSLLRQIIPALQTLFVALLHLYYFLAYVLDEPLRFHQLRLKISFSFVRWF